MKLVKITLTAPSGSGKEEVYRNIRKVLESKGYECSELKCTREDGTPSEYFEVSKDEP